MFCGPYFILSTMQAGTTTIFNIFGITSHLLLDIAMRYMYFISKMHGHGYILTADLKTGHVACHLAVDFKNHPSSC